VDAKNSGGADAASLLAHHSALRYMKYMKLIKKNLSDFEEALIFLFLFTLILGVELGSLEENLFSHGSIILSKPILFSDSILTTISNFLLFSIPAIIFVAALNKKQLLLKFAYFGGTLPLILTTSVINKFGYKGLFALKIIMLFFVVIFLIRYLKKTAASYKIP